MTLLALLCLGIFGGFLSGLLGIGGGIVMLPLLTAIPVDGGTAMAVRGAVGVTMLQSLAGSFLAIVIHRQKRAVDPRLAFLVGGGAAIGSLFGALLSKRLPEAMIASVFLLLAVAAIVLLLVPQEDAENAVIPDVRSLPAVALGGGAGIVAGIVGQGGAFFILPLMIRILKVPVRLAIGTTAAVAFLSALTGFAGKWMTGQVPLGAAVSVTVGAIVGASLGGGVSHNLSAQILKRCLLGVLLLSVLLIVKKVTSG